MLQCYISFASKNRVQMSVVKKIPAKIQELYAIVAELETLFPGRHFTPDGHLVGSIGEVLGAYHYGLDLLPASAKTHDATNKEGKLVQIKATQRKLVGIRSEPQYLLVLGINEQGESEEIYNGPGKLAWDAAGKMQKNGQRMISKTKLHALMKTIKHVDRLPRLN